MRENLHIRLARELERDHIRKAQRAGKLAYRKFKLNRGAYKIAYIKRRAVKLEAERMPWPEPSIAALAGLRFSPPSSLDPKLWDNFFPIAPGIMNPTFKENPMHIAMLHQTLKRWNLQAGRPTQRINKE